MEVDFYNATFILADEVWVLREESGMIWGWLFISDVLQLRFDWRAFHCWCVHVALNVKIPAKISLSPSLSVSLSVTLPLSAQSLYPRPTAQVSLTGSRPIPARCQSSTAAGNRPERGRRRGEKSERSTHPAISPSIHPSSVLLHASQPDTQADRHTGSSFSLPPLFLPSSAWSHWLQLFGLTGEARGRMRDGTSVRTRAPLP